MPWVIDSFNVVVPPLTVVVPVPVIDESNTFVPDNPNVALLSIAVSNPLKLLFDIFTVPDVFVIP